MDDKKDFCSYLNDITSINHLIGILANADDFKGLICKEPFKGLVEDFTNPPKSEINDRLFDKDSIDHLKLSMIMCLADEESAVRLFNELNSYKNAIFRQEEYITICDSAFAELSQKLCSNIKDKTILWLQSLTDCTLSGEDDSLENIWEEVCAQIQHDYSMFWSEYLAEIERYVSSCVATLTDIELLAVCSQLHGAYDFIYFETYNSFVNQNDSNRSDAVNYIVNEYILKEAETWQNDNIQSYISSRTY